MGIYIFDEHSFKEYVLNETKVILKFNLNISVYSDFMISKCNTEFINLLT